MLLKLFSNMHRHLVPYVIVIILYNCSQTYSKETFSVIDNVDEYGNIIVRNKYSSFDFGEEFYVDEILREIEEMGLRPRRITQPVNSQSGENCIDSCTSSDSSRSQQQQAQDKVELFLPSIQIEQTTTQNRIEIVDGSIPKESVNDDPKVPSRETVNESESESTGDVIEKIHEGNIDEVLASLQRIVGLSGMSLDYSEDGAEDNNIIQSVKKRSTDDEEGSSIKKTGMDEVSMAESISDILGPVKGERQARLFYNFDRGSAFNTSVAFTIPLFSFTLPGAGDITSDGLDSNVFGTMAFVSLFLLGGLAVAIYTTTQGALGDPGTGTGSAPRSFNPEFPGAQMLQGGPDESLTQAVLSALHGLSEALDLPSCSQLAACEAHQHPSEYGVVGLPFRVMAPLRPEVPLEDITPMEAAARLGSEGGDCYWEFPCIMDPLQFMELGIDLIAGKFS